MLNWVWPSLKRYIMFMFKPSHLIMNMHQKLTKHGKYCMLNLMGLGYAHPKKGEKSKAKIDHLGVATGIIYDVTSSSSWSKSICNPKMDIMRIGRPQKTIAFSQRWLSSEWTRTIGPHLISPKDKPLGSHMIGWKYAVHYDISTTIGGP